MDPATAKMALQLAATLARSRAFRYAVIASTLFTMLTGAAIIVGPEVLVTEIAANMRGDGSQQQADTSVDDCAAQIGATAAPAHGFTAEQVGNAKIIWTVARQMSDGERGAVVGIATALQESTLRNLPYGDLDSIGLFQQRGSWGSTATRLNPVDSSKLFFRALNKVNGWQKMAVDVAAQSVQGSAFPTAYANQVQAAVNLVTFLETKYSPGSTLDTTGSGLCDGQTATSTSLGKIALPVDHYVLTAGFGQCGSHWANCHTGLDFAAPTGTPIHAVMAGKVVWTGWGGAYGNLTKIQHPDNVQTWYAHQSAISVKVGDAVTAGQTIGRVGATGNTTGPHVHLEVRTNGTPVDPNKWLTDHGVKP